MRRACLQRANRDVGVEEVAAIARDEQLAQTEVAERGQRHAQAQVCRVRRHPLARPARIPEVLARYGLSRRAQSLLDEPHQQAAHDGTLLARNLATTEAEPP